MTDCKHLLSSNIPDGTELIVAAHSHWLISGRCIDKAKHGGIGFHPSLVAAVEYGRTLGPFRTSSQGNTHLGMAGMEVKRIFVGSKDLRERSLQGPPEGWA